MVKVNDINMYYEVHGEGMPLVFIGGLGNDLTVFDPIILTLTKKFKVIAFDNRGAGRTDKPDIPYTIEMMADDTAGLLNVLGIKQAYVLGVSMGGRIALALALRHPEMVKSLVLTSTFARQRENTSMPMRFTLMRRLPLIRKMVSGYPQPDYAFARQFKASRGYDCSGQLDKITVPTLILHGTKDRLAPIELAEEMHSGIKGSKMLTFQGGHVFFMGHQAHFCKAIIHFLDGLDK